MSLTAIFGGTFNPLHIGHYEILKALQEEDEISKIFIMPDRIPPHKVCDFLADDKTRIEMCKIASQDFSKAEVCLIEFERNGKSYTYDTVKELKVKYPLENFAFVCGGDMLVSFDRWYKYDELLTMLPFIAFRRSDTDNSAFDESIDKFTKMGMKIKVIERNIPNISSSEIRNDFSKAKEMLPQKIFDYLKEKGIYNA